MKSCKHEHEVDSYVKGMIDGSIVANEYRIKGAKRYLSFKEKYDFNPRDAEIVIKLIESSCVHYQGEDLKGNPLKGKPFLLTPYHKYIIYACLSFYKKDGMPLTSESLIFMPRKNIKTTFAVMFGWALSIVWRKSGSKLYIVSAAMKQSLESFNFVNFNLKQMGEAENCRIIDNNQEHSIARDFLDGTVFIQALASSVERQDSLNCNIGIADEMHTYKTPIQYKIIKEAQKAYRKKLMIGISSAGFIPNGYLAHRIEYAKKVLDGEIDDDSLFIFLCEPDNPDDFTNEIEHEKANPGYNISVSGEELMQEALEALSDPQVRPTFLAKSLNVFSGQQKAYFITDDFRESNDEAERKLKLRGNTKQKLEQLTKLPIKWYGGADLSKIHDLTAGAIYGEYNDIAIAITHAWFPVVSAHAKADQDNIPLFGWKDNGWLTMTNDAVVNYADVVKWFKSMRDMGFNIKQVSFDKKFGKEFFLMMKQARFRMVDAPQYFWWKNIGFRRIEAKTKMNQFYYLGSEAFEYCVGNVHGIEKTDDMIQYEKVQPTQRIDIFDASVFAASALVDDIELKQKAKGFISSL